jgi:Tol biopolymer transport system component/predicted Ser/Thr protein kinase
VIGSKLGPYEITAKLGEGGMGEVYKARDTRLDRTVAIKVLPARLAAAPDLRARFEREARAISALNHPHICVLYDVGHQNGVEYLVMEYIEGQTLADRLAKGALPTADVLRWGIEIADALDRAHRQGVVHRDLKPGNVMLTKAGVKLLDFGLAKLTVASAIATGAVLAAMPTEFGEGQPLTGAGTILGTFQYMAPEQLEGREADTRADLWALGCVLSEMATGKKTFVGQGHASLISSIMTAEPLPLSQIQPMVRPALDRLVRRCLAKDPEERWQSARDVVSELKWIAEGESQVAAAAPEVMKRNRRERLTWGAVMLVLGLTAGIGAAVLLLRAPLPATSPDTLRLDVLPPDGSLSSGPFDLSPDGRAIVFTATGPDGKTALYWRGLDMLDARKLPGTEDASLPFFSPDGRSVGFFSGKSLERIDLVGGPPRELAAASDPRGASWGAAGVIVFSPDSGGPLFRVPAEGGDAVAVTKLDAGKQESSHRWPHFLPDGKRFLFMSRKPEPPRLSLELGSLDGKERKRLADADSSARYGGGNLFFQRQTTLFAQRFDPVRGALSGEPRPLADDAWIDSDTDGLAAFAASSDARFAYRRGGIVQSRLTWIDRQGRAIRTVGEAGLLYGLNLSPDGRRILIVRNDPSPTGWVGNVYVVDDASAMMTRVTFTGNATSPLFSPDGTRVAYASDHNGPFDLFEHSVSGTGEEKLLLATPHWKYPESWSPDGKFLSYRVIDPVTGVDIWILPRTAGAKPFPLLRTAAAESNSRFSPDGRFLAYTCDESGREEVFVQPFPATGAKWQVSRAGGFSAAWRADGGELYYAAPDSQLMAVTVTRSPAGLVFAPPRALFRLPIKRGGSTSNYFAAARDGQSFLVLERPTEAVASSIVVVLGLAAPGAPKP